MPSCPCRDTLCDNFDDNHCYRRRNTMAAPLEKTIAAVWFSCLLICNAIVAEAAMATTQHRLPADRDAVVVVFDSSGGFRAQPKTAAPILVVHASGRVTLANPSEEGTIERNISAEQVQELLGYMLDENKFFDIDPAEVKRSIDDEEAEKQALAHQQGIVRVGPNRSADATTILVRVQADGREHEVSFDSPHTLAREYPSIAKLARFRAIQVRLIQLQTELLKKQDR